MKKLFSLFTLIAFLSISYISVSHFHKNTETGSKADCPLCAFSHTVPVVPSAHTVSVIPVIFQEMITSPAAVAVATSLFVLPEPRAPPAIQYSL